MMTKKEFRLNFGGKEVTVETGRLAKQADGSVFVTSGKTQVLVTVCSARTVKPDQGFFPLTVEYTEKFYAAGKFLGGFLKREGKPSTPETLNARLIDRPLRPLFPEGYLAETVVTCTVLSYGNDGDPEILASLGASAALAISDIPWDGPIGACKVGKIDGQFVINPNFEDWANSEFEIAVSASEDAILMVEGEALEHPEKEVLEAILFAHKNIKEFCHLVKTMQKEVGRKKREFTPVLPNATLMEKLEKAFASEARTALNISEKLERQNAVAKLTEKIKTTVSAEATNYGLTEDADFGKASATAVEHLLYKLMRADVLTEGKRIQGRALDQVRKITTEVDILKSPHGSALFTRGETQVIGTVTIGGSKGDQMVDRIVGQHYDKFYLHYAFPGYSVGEARASRGVGRRELGHGNLAERALKAVIPQQEKFSYTIRVACEVTESNGSSSMGSVCAGSMALMDAGVPLNAPVAGIAMGLVSDGNKYRILTDIIGDEDNLGDMDFKVAGTSKGITAIQMDIKIKGLTTQILEEALEQARKGRLHILGEMAKTITKERGAFKEGVPRIEMIKIEQDKIGALIGPGGKNIKGLQENYGVTIEVDEDGTVRVLGSDPTILNACVSTIKLQLTGPEVGADYLGTVVTVKDYGAFVDLAPGVSGLVHVSEFTNERVNDPNEYVATGDQFQVRVVEIDRMGRIKLSAKVVAPIPRKTK